MRLRTAVPTVVAAAAALLAVPLAAPSWAATCQAAATPATLVPRSSRLQATGAVHCADTEVGLALTVCIQESTDPADAGSWSSLGCATTGSSGEGQTLTGQVAVRVPTYATFLRTTAVATDVHGVVAATATPPLLWVNCAC